MLRLLRPNRQRAVIISHCELLEVAGLLKVDGWNDDLPRLTGAATGNHLKLLLSATHPMKGALVHLLWWFVHMVARLTTDLLDWQVHWLLAHLWRGDQSQTEILMLAGSLLHLRV